VLQKNLTGIEPILSENTIVSDLFKIKQKIIESKKSLKNLDFSSFRFFIVAGTGLEPLSAAADMSPPI